MPIDFARLTRRAAACTLAALLAACGGGGGGSSGPTVEAPPQSPATLQSSSGDAAGATIAAAASAQRLVQLGTTVNTGFGGASGLAAPTRGAVPARLFADWSRTALGLHGRKQSLAVQTVGCADFLGTSGCSGSVTIDTNFAATGSHVIPAGTYVAITFGALQGVNPQGAPIALNGTFRLDYLTAIDLNASTLANVQFQITLAAFGGSVNGLAFGPETEIAIFAFDADGTASLTVDGLRIVNLDGITIVDAGDFSLTGVAVRVPHWTSSTGYVDFNFVDWNVTANRPVIGSTVIATAGANSITVNVSASSSTTVIYGVVASVGGAVAAYTVTASYPPGGGAPTYTVSPA